MPRELLGTQALRSVLVCVTFTAEQSLLLKFASPTAESLIWINQVPVASPPGIATLTRLVEPSMVVMLSAKVEVTTGPPHVPSHETTMLLGVIMPARKPEPVALTLLTPATPVLGIVLAFNFTDVTAQEVSGKSITQQTQKAVFNTRFGLVANLAVALVLLRVPRHRNSRRPPEAVANNTHVLGSGTGGGPPAGLAAITAKSPSFRFSPAEGKILAVKPALMFAVEPSLSATVSGLKSPVKIASMG